MKQKQEKKRAHMPKKEYMMLREKIENNEITINDIDNETILEIARYKLYYMFLNAYHRTQKRKEYEGVEYRLGAYSEALENLKKHRPDLHRKYLYIIRTYIKNQMNPMFAPSIHRTKKHYDWEHIDIVTVREHMKIDTYVSVIVRNETGKMTGKTKRKRGRRLTMKDIKKMVKGKKFESITAAIEYLKNTYGVSENSIRKYIDSGETIDTENGRFEIVREQNVEKVDDETRRRRHEMFLQRYPQFHEIGQKFIELIRNTDEKKLRFILKWSMIRRKKWRIVRADKRFSIVRGNVDNYFKISV
ncbi:hypothetical protein [Anoxybacillus gonensis]|uniref:hypothetical protein n=1 Tax=Anoxybacillus gonensis TaxID=198467 RepID=UPI000FFE80EF|nr:hypothetical protein [Anoxybacillus gonensis]